MSQHVRFRNEIPMLPFDFQVVGSEPTRFTFHTFHLNGSFSRAQHFMYPKLPDRHPVMPTGRIQFVQACDLDGLRLAGHIEPVKIIVPMVECCQKKKMPDGLSILASGKRRWVGSLFTSSSGLASTLLGRGEGSFAIGHVVVPHPPQDAQPLEGQGANGGVVGLAMLLLSFDMRPGPGALDHA